MKHILLVALVPLALSGSAFAQPPTQQPAIPDDGVGVDYTQPYMNDLLLRTEPVMRGNQVRDQFRWQVPEAGCEEELQAFKERRPGASLALRECAFDQQPGLREEYQQWLRRPFRFGPDMDRRPLDPSDDNFTIQRMPPVHGHPNAQN